jgi:GNAT superfamily N-acetyltransferase
MSGCDDSSLELVIVPMERYRELPELICRSIRQSAIVRDYGSEIAENICAVYNPETIGGVLEDAHVIAVEREGTYIGTGCLKGFFVTTVFVLPSEHGRGIGRAIMKSLEMEAIRRGLREVELHSSISAAPFYERIGYEYVLRELQDGGNRGDHFHMKKLLA